MKLYQFAIALTALSFIGLAGCNQTEQASTSTSSMASSSPAASPSPSTQATMTNGVKPEFTGLLGVVTKTQAAVEASDYAKAQTDFDQFEEFWSKVEDGVKAKSPDTYNAIEDNADQVKSALKASDKAKASTALQNLHTSITSVAKS